MSEMMQYDFTVLEHQLSLIKCEASPEIARVLQMFLVFSQVNCSSYCIISHAVGKERLSSSLQISVVPVWLWLLALKKISASRF